MQFNKLYQWGAKKYQLNMLNKDIIYKSQLNLDWSDRYIFEARGGLTNSLSHPGPNPNDLATLLNCAMTV